MLTIEKLRVAYPSGSDVLKGLNLSMDEGLVHGLIGLNGSGKTTLLKTLYGFLKPVEGNISFRNQPLKRKDTGYLEVENYFYPDMKGSEYLALFPEGETKFREKDWEELFSLPLEQITETYSTGMRKKLALLAVIKQDKPFIMLDEPFNGLDLESSRLLTYIILRLREKNKTLLITSHVYETLTNCCDFIHYLNNGIILKTYTPESFHLLNDELDKTMQERIAKMNDLF